MVHAQRGACAYEDNSSCIAEGLTTCTTSMASRRERQTRINMHLAAYLPGPAAVSMLLPLAG